MPHFLNGKGPGYLLIVCSVYMHTAGKILMIAGKKGLKNTGIYNNRF